MAEVLAENYWLFLYTNTKGLNSRLAIRLSIDCRYGLACPTTATGGGMPMIYSRIESQKRTCQQLVLQLKLRRYLN